MVIASKKNVIYSLFWKFGERISAQLITLIVSIILARILSPEDYGAVALIMVFITFANVFVSNGLGNALIQKKDVDNIDYSSVFFLNIGISIIIYFILFFCAPFIANFYQMPILENAIKVLGLRIPVAAINSVQQAYVSRNMLFKKFFFSTLFGTLISGVLGIILAYYGAGLWALVAQYMTNTITDTIVLWFTVKWRPSFIFSIKRSNELFKYGWKILVSGLLETGYNELRNLLIGKMYSSSSLAYYNQADKYPKLIITNIDTSIGSVLFPALSQNQDNKCRIRYITRKSIQTSSFFIWPLMVGLAVISEPLVRILLTDKWIPCVPYMQILCLSYGLYPMHTANLQAINAIGRSDIYLKLEIIKKIVGLIILLLSIKHGVYAITLSLLITSIISVFINAIPNIRFINYQLKDQLKDLFNPFFVSIVMSIIIIPLQFLNISNYLLIIIQIVIGMFVYFSLSYLLKIPGYVFGISIIKNSFKTKKRK